jgi:hypothetical protein
MKRYSLTSTSFEGEVIFEFNEHELLVSFDTKGATMSEEQQTFLLRNLPRDLYGVKLFAEKSPTARLEEIKTEVTFSQFWDRYDEKIRSSKKKAEKAWNKLSKIDQVNAFQYIAKYNLNLHPGTAKKYAETYLNAELWNN